MSDIENPWQSPENASVPAPPPGVQPVLTAAMLRYLKEAVPWLRFIGIMGFIGSGCTAVAGIILPIVGLSTANLTGVFAFFPPALFGLVYVGIGALMFFPARFTYCFGAKLRNYQLSNSERELEEAFKNNKSLWKFNGIITIVYLAFIPVMIIIGVVMVTIGITA